jgi:hypothetical protein
VQADDEMLEEEQEVLEHMQPKAASSEHLQ